MSPDQMKKISEDAVMPVYFKFTMAFILSVIIGVILRFIWLQIENVNPILRSVSAVGRKSEFLLEVLSLKQVV